MEKLAERQELVQHKRHPTAVAHNVPPERNTVNADAAQGATASMLGSGGVSARPVPLREKETRATLSHTDRQYLRPGLSTSMEGSVTLGSDADRQNSKSRTPMTDVATAEVEYFRNTVVDSSNSGRGGFKRDGVIASATNTSQTPNTPFWVSDVLEATATSRHDSPFFGNMPNPGRDTEEKQDDHENQESGEDGSLGLFSTPPPKKVPNSVFHTTPCSLIFLLAQAALVGDTLNT